MELLRYDSARALQILDIDILNYRDIKKLNKRLLNILDRYRGLSFEVAQRLIARNRTQNILENIASFSPSAHCDIAKHILASPQWATETLKHLSEFQGLDEKQIMLDLINSYHDSQTSDAIKYLKFAKQLELDDYYNVASECAKTRDDCRLLLEHLGEVPEVDHNKVVRLLIDAGNSELALRYRNKYKDFDIDAFALYLIEAGHAKQLISYSGVMNLPDDMSVVKAPNSVGTPNGIAGIYFTDNHGDKQVVVTIGVKQVIGKPDEVMASLLADVKSQLVPVDQIVDQELESEYSSSANVPGNSELLATEFGKPAKINWANVPNAEVQIALLKMGNPGLVISPMDITG